MLSVITPTVRHEGLKLVEKALKQQTMEYEWIIGSPTPPTLTIPYIWVEDPPKRDGDYWTIYKCYNEMVRRAKGDLIISWQDYTYARPDTLERLWFHHRAEPKTLVGVVGNKYSDETWRVKTWKDPRETDKFGSFYPCYFNDVEWNLCAVPRDAIYEVGGFDEELDKYSSLCGLDVLARLNFKGGYDFKLDQSIKTFSTEHGRLPEWDKFSPFNGVWERKLKEYKTNPILGYLN